MTWSWQRPEWPNFSWNSDLLRDAEAQFRIDVRTLVGTFADIAANDREQLILEILSAEAIATSKIEGEILDAANVQSAISARLGVVADRRRAKAAEEGIAELMVDLHGSFSEPLSDDMLFAWHRMCMNGRADLRLIGGYRIHETPMQIISGPIHDPKVHFVAPPSAEVPREMKRFIAWFNQSAPDGQFPLPALTRAGVAHFYFESIHPFEDGNGRIGRAIAGKALAQSLASPPLAALSLTILAKRKAYYEALGRDQKETDLTAWLRWFAGVAIEAQQQTVALVRFFLDKRRLLDSLEGRLNARQQKALLRVMREGPEGFKGGLSASNYIAITGASAPAATRDLVDMIAKGALLRYGRGRHARYWPKISQRQIAPVMIDERGEVVMKGRRYMTQMGAATPDFHVPARSEATGPMEPATADLLRSLIRGHVRELIDEIEEAKQSAERDKEARPNMHLYAIGQHFGFYMALRTLFYRAGELGIDLQEIGLEGIDPDDLV
jgi:Fic family protein